MRSRIARIVVAAAVAATPLAACSGDPKQEFIAAADDVCAEADEQIKEIGTPRVEEGVRDYVAGAERISEELVSDLRALEPPEEDRDRIDEMIDGLERATSLLGPLSEAIVDRDAQAVEELQQEVEQVTDEVSEIAEKYGFETCGAKVLDPLR